MNTCMTHRKLGTRARFSVRARLNLEELENRTVPSCSNAVAGPEPAHDDNSSSMAADHRQADFSNHGQHSTQADQHASANSDCGDQSSSNQDTDHNSQQDDRQDNQENKAKKASDQGAKDTKQHGDNDDQNQKNKANQ